MEKLVAKHIDFIREQDGEVERELETNLLNCFVEERNVAAAYLALVRYEDGTESVALCLRIRSDTEPQTELIAKIEKTFAAMFSKREHLDVCFVNDRQEEDLSKVCKSFYRAPADA